MADPHVITALVKKRGELAGEIQTLRRHRASARSKLTLVDKALKLFGYEGDPRAIRPRRRQLGRIFGRGELRRFVFDMLRGARGPLTNSAIAVLMIEAKGWDGSDTELLAAVAGKVKDVRKLIRTPRAR